MKSIDISGKTFGDRTVIGDCVRKGNRKARYWLCRCKCGNESYVRQSHLTSGQSKKCRYCNAKKAAIIRDAANFQQQNEKYLNKRFGKYIIKEILEEITTGKRDTICDCDCGTKNRRVSLYSLISGRSKSCGCTKSGNSFFHYDKAINNPSSWNNKRHLYRIVFVNKISGKIFTKIGIYRSHKIIYRYPKKYLIRAGLEIKFLESVELKNIETVFSEKYILEKYSYFSICAEELSEIGGKTECLGCEILPLKNEIEEALSSKKYKDLIGGCNE